MSLESGTADEVSRKKSRRRKLYLEYEALTNKRFRKSKTLAWSGKKKTLKSASSLELPLPKKTSSMSRTKYWLYLGKKGFPERKVKGKKKNRKKTTRWRPQARANDSSERTALAGKTPSRDEKIP